MKILNFRIQRQLVLRIKHGTDDTCGTWRVKKISQFTARRVKWAHCDPTPAKLAKAPTLIPASAFAPELASLPPEVDWPPPLIPPLKLPKLPLVWLTLDKVPIPWVRRVPIRADPGGDPGTDPWPDPPPTFFKQKD